MLTQGTATPLYVQLMNEVEKSILSGAYQPGDKLMTEAEMAKTYGVSLITVRKAIGSLTEKGLVVRRQGKGTFVAKPKFSRNMKKLQSFSEMCEQMGVRPGAKMLENRLVSADEKTAQRLGVDPGSSVVYIERSWFPLRYAFLLDACFDDNSLFDFLREKDGSQVASSEKIIELCRATAEEARLLEVKQGDYLLFVRSTAYERSGEPMYAGIQIINGDRFSLYVYESSGEDLL